MSLGPFLLILMGSVIAIPILYLVGRWRTETTATPTAAGTQLRRFGCGLAIAAAILLVLFGVFMVFAIGSAGVCCY